MADVKWIKIVTDVFDDEKILLVESLPEADSIIVIWFKLLCLAGKQNNSGVFLMNDKIPYTDKMLATIFRRKESTVQLALRTFQDFGMIEIVDGVITIPNWEKHQNLQKLEMAREQTRKRVAKHRAGQKLLASGVQDETLEAEGKEECNGDVTRYSNVTEGVTVTQCNADRIDKNRIDKNRIDNIKYIVEYLNSTIGSNYKHTTKTTKESINARLNEGFTIEDFKTVIDNQYTKWKGTEWEQYLRPQTLFGTKFESYLNAPVTTKKDSNANIDWKEWDKKNNSTSQIDSADIEKLLKEGEIF